tara:strand:+ start:491 stop:883 length:393 start_codon:yes stop_codon:yes gene_type:complete
MDDELENKIIEIPFNHKEEEEKLHKVLDDIKELNRLQTDLSSIMVLQKENIDRINTLSENAADASRYANSELEAASGRKFKMLPVMLGTGLGVVITLPITLGFGLSAGAVGGIVAGGSVIGGMMGKNLAK